MQQPAYFRRVMCILWVYHSHHPYCWPFLEQYYDRSLKLPLGDTLQFTWNVTELSSIDNTRIECNNKFFQNALIFVNPRKAFETFAWKTVANLVRLPYAKLSNNDMHQPMMTSSNGNIFRATGHLCGAFTGRRWIPGTKTSDAELWCFLLSAPE